MRILHVDDNLGDRDIIKISFSKHNENIVVEGVDSASEAYLKIVKNKYDCIISDYQMPGTDGVDFIRQIRASGISTPFIFLTGQGNEKIAADAIRAGADNYYQKEAGQQFYQKLIKEIESLVENHELKMTQFQESGIFEEYIQYRIFSESTREGLVIHNKGLILGVNSAMIRLIRAEKSDLIGKSALDFVCDEFRDVTWKNLSEGHSKPYEINIKRKDGTIFNAEIQGKTVNLRGNTYRVVAVRDITEQKRIQYDLKEKSESLAAYSYTVSHDLKTPIWQLDSYCQLLEYDLANIGSVSLLNTISKMRKTTRHMNNLIKDLLSFSTLSQHDMKMDKVNLSTFADEILNDLIELQPERNVELDVEKDVITTGDPVLLQVLMNHLLNNAWKFSSRRNKTKIKFGQANNNDGTAEYFIMDNGIGIPDDKMELIFKPFNRLHSKEGFEGSGIGLATVKRIVDLHSGQIRVESKPGEETIIFFSLNH